MRRFYSPQPIRSVGQIIFLGSGETRHLSSILRLKEGGRCLVTDGMGQEAEARIIRFLGNGVSELIIEAVHTAPASAARVHLRMLPALMGKGKIDFLVEKAQELGVDEFWPVETKRSAIRMDKEKGLKVLSRWNKIAREAAKQSGVRHLMKVTAVQGVESAIRSLKADENLVLFHTLPESIPFREWIGRMHGEARRGFPLSLNLLIGPEGGFTAGEIHFAKTESQKKGNLCTIVSLGEATLKADTAFLAAAAAVRLLLT